MTLDDLTPAPSVRAGVDAATGLIYVGNGQYYDPSTGRFLTRDAKPGQVNPYIPWDGASSGSLIVAPLIILALVYGNKRKRSKWDMLVIALVLGGAVALSLSACGPGTPTAAPQPQPTGTPSPTPTETPTPGGGGQGGGTDTGTQTPTPDPANKPPIPDCPTAPTGTPAPTAFDKALLPTVKHNVTNISALDLYEHYLSLWENNSGWWQSVFGGDADGFSFWDYIALYLNHEASYSHTEFVDIMAEAGVRLWHQRVKEGYDKPGDYGFIDWWASFSQSTAENVKNKTAPDQNATKKQYQDFLVASNKYKNPPSDWTTGLDAYRPYNWGNKSAIQLHSRNKKAAEMLAANANKYPIIYGFIPGDNPFYILSGCAQLNWYDNTNENQETAWNPNACDYLLNK